MTTPNRSLLGRRQFLGLSAFALAAAACRGSVSAPTTNLNRASLRVLNWSDYIDPSEGNLIGTVDRFQRATGISTSYDPDWVGNYEAIDDQLAPLLSGSGGTGYDIITPTYWLAAQLRDADLLDPIPLASVPNHVNVDPAFLGLPWDRGGRFNMPWQVGITGIAYNRNRIPEGVNSLADLFALPAGRYSLIGEMREAVGLVLLDRGIDPSRATADEAHAAMDAIEALGGAPQGFNFGGIDDPTSFTSLLKAGTIDAAMAWSGDIVQLQATNPEIEFVIPDAGAIRWFDTMVIPRGASNRGAAGDWMNFVYDPKEAAQLTSWVQYISPVLGVQDELRSFGGADGRALADNPILFPDASTEQRLVSFGGPTVAQEQELDDRYAAIAGL